MTKWWIKNVIFSSPLFINSIVFILKLLLNTLISLLTPLKYCFSLFVDKSTTDILLFSTTSSSEDSIIHRSEESDFNLILEANPDKTYVYLGIDPEDNLTYKAIKEIIKHSGKIFIISLSGRLNFVQIIFFCLFSRRRIFLAHDFVRNNVQFLISLMSRKKDRIVCMDCSPKNSIYRLRNATGPHIALSSLFRKNLLTPPTVGEKEFRIFFSGTTDPRRREYLNEITSKINILDIYPPRFTPREYYEIMSKYKIHLNFNDTKYIKENGIYNKNFLFQLKGRVGESFISKSLLLTNGHEAIPDYFHDGEHYLSWNSIDELFELIEFAISEPSRVERIALQAYNRCKDYLDESRINFVL